jgi:hypothetical protein
MQNPGPNRQIVQNGTRRAKRLTNVERIKKSGFRDDHLHWTASFLGTNLEQGGAAFS